MLTITEYKEDVPSALPLEGFREPSPTCAPRYPQQPCEVGRRGVLNPVEMERLKLREGKVGGSGHIAG